MVDACDKIKIPALVLSAFCNLHAKILVIFGSISLIPPSNNRGSQEYSSAEALSLLGASKQSMLFKICHIIINGVLLDKKIGKGKRFLYPGR